MTRETFFLPRRTAAALLVLLLVGCRDHERHDRDRESRDQAPSAAQAAPPAPADASVGSETVVNEAPPAPLAETETPSPGPDYAWIGGVWVWNDRWVWQGGHWDRRPRAGATWVPHRTIERGGRHVFVRGGWK